MTLHACLLDIQSSILPLQPPRTWCAASARLPPSLYCRCGRALPCRCVVAGPSRTDRRRRSGRSTAFARSHRRPGGSSPDEPFPGSLIAEIGVETEAVRGEGRPRPSDRPHRLLARQLGSWRPRASSIRSEPCAGRWSGSCVVESAEILACFAIAECANLHEPDGGGDGQAKTHRKKRDPRLIATMTVQLGILLSPIRVAAMGSQSPVRPTIPSNGCSGPSLLFASSRYSFLVKMRVMSSVPTGFV